MTKQRSRNSLKNKGSDNSGFSRLLSDSEKRIIANDQLYSRNSSFANSLKATSTKTYRQAKLSKQDLLNYSRSYLMEAVINRRSSLALRDAVDTVNMSESDIAKLQSIMTEIITAFQYAQAMGRGILLLTGDNRDVSEPLLKGRELRVKAFSGYDISASESETDLNSADFGKPKRFMIQGKTVHNSRVIDFCYKQPTVTEAAMYEYGGISLTELVFDVLVPLLGTIDKLDSILNQLSFLVYRMADVNIDGCNSEEEIRATVKASTISIRENGIMAIAGGDDHSQSDVFAISQNFSGIETIFRQLDYAFSIATGYPISSLVGEHLRGIGAATGAEDNQLSGLKKELQQDYLTEPMTKLFEVLELGDFKWKEAQSQSEAERIDNELKIAQTAAVIASVGGDAMSYLERNQMIDEAELDDFSESDFNEAQN